MSLLLAFLGKVVEKISFYLTLCMGRGQDKPKFSLQCVMYPLYLNDNLISGSWPDIRKKYWGPLFPAHFHNMAA